MVDVPYLDHLWDGQKDCLDVGQVREIQRRVTEFQPKRTLSNSNPNGGKTSQKTLIQPKMGV